MLAYELRGRCHPDLTDLSLHGKTALVKAIPFDPGIVLAFLKGKWVICKSDLHQLSDRTPELMKRCLFEEYRCEQALVRTSSDKSRLGLSKLLQRLNEKALQNNDYWAEEDSQKLLSIASFEQPSDKAQQNALSSLNTMMQSALSQAVQAGKYGQLVSELI